MKHTGSRFCLKKVCHCGTCVRLTPNLLLFVLGHTFGLCADCADSDFGLQVKHSQAMTAVQLPLLDASSVNLRLFLRFVLGHIFGERVRTWSRESVFAAMSAAHDAAAAYAVSKLSGNVRTDSLRLLSSSFQFRVPPDSCLDLAATADFSQP